MLQRLPLPAQFDRLIMQGGLLAGLIAGPLLVVLLVLLIGDRITAPEFVFWLAAALIITGALGAVLMSNLVYAALSLIATLLGVAALFLLLASEFLALVQVLVYGGGVTILLLFGLMLTNAADDPVVSDGSQKPFAAIIAAVMGAVFIVAVYDATWADTVPVVIPLSDFGERLFRDFLVPVIIVALLLDVALSGAFVNARVSPEEEEMEATGPGAEGQS